MFSSTTPTLLVGTRRLVGAELLKRPTNPKNVRTMVSLKDIRLRIRGISAISKLTKTMQMVASSKLRSAQRKVDLAKPIAQSVDKALGEVPIQFNRGKNLILAVTSDKGMCGSINNQIARHAKTLIRDESDPAKLVVGTTGGKAASSFAVEFPNQMAFSFRDIGKKEFTFMEIGIAVDHLLSIGNYNSVNIIYNKFKNALTYLVTEKKIAGPATMEAYRYNKFALYEFDEDEDATFRDLFEFQIATTIWGAVAENRASELAARMSSMDSATKNATSIINLLAIQYNRGRQATITTELIEITSGASALEVEDD